MIYLFSKNNLDKLVFIFLITYPIFDLIFFYNSFTTIIRMFIVIFFTIWLLVINKDFQKKFKWILVYFVILLIYAIFHHINALNFKSLMPGNFYYLKLKELLYLFKYSIPLLFMYFLYYLKLDKKYYFKILKFWIIFISGSIIITNLFKISLGSYSNEIIKGNIFNWFNTNLTYYDLASKGLFMYANQISCILVCLIPIIYHLFTNKKIKLYYLVILMISLLMLGTRVANIGGIIALFLSITIYLFFVIIKKEKFEFKSLLYSLIVIIISALILPFSPTMNRYKIFNYILEVNSKVYYATSEQQIKIDYIRKNYQEKQIYPLFILERYPYQYDPDFWYDIMQLDYSYRANYRYLEISMLERVKKINNNKWDDWLGITNVRVQNIFNVERDFLLQYYCFGIIGSIILLLVYILILFKNIFNFIKSFCYKNAIMVLITSLFLLISYFTGNILSQLGIPIMYIFVNNFDIDN